MKITFTILAFFSWTFLFGQVSILQAEIHTDNSKTLGGIVIFPITNDTLKIDDSGIAKVNISDSNKRLLYFVWSGWKSKILRFENGFCEDSVYNIFVPDTLFYKPFQKNKICPICKKNKFLIPIKYGMPGKKMLRQAEKGKIILGGCIIYDWNPQWYCKKDQFEF